MAKAGTNSKLILRLYVAGNAPNSLLAIANVKAVCAAHFADKYKIEIVDLLKYPKRALKDGVIVTPTLLKLMPPPVQRVIGNLSDTTSVILTLSNDERR